MPNIAMGDAWELDLDELSPRDNQCGKQGLVHCKPLQTHHLKTNQVGLNLSLFLHEPATCE